MINCHRKINLKKTQGAVYYTEVKNAYTLNVLDIIYLKPILYCIPRHAYHWVKTRRKTDLPANHS